MSAHSCATIKRLLGKVTREGAEINYTTRNLVGFRATFCSVLNTRGKRQWQKGRIYSWILNSPGKCTNWGELQPQPLGALPVSPLAVTSALSHWSLLLLVVFFKESDKGRVVKKISRVGFQPLAIREKQKQNLIFCCCFGVFFSPPFVKGIPHLYSSFIF